MSQWLAEKSSAVLQSRTSRRGFLVRSALAGSALAVSPLRYLLRPVTAYAAICGCAGSDCNCGSSCCDGYTEFCCAVNDGKNACPPGTFEAGWWRADGSQFCDGPRYYTDCNAQCGSGACSCHCAGGDCDNRRTCCNVFRYGQCNQHIECYGAIACRVVTCTPPYELFNCDRTTLWDDSTANHTSNCAAAQPPPPPPPAEPAPPPPPTGPVVLGDRITVSHDGKALDVAFASVADGAGVIVWPPNGGTNQKWSIEPLGDGSFRIVAGHSGKVLDVNGASTADGAGVIQWPWNGGLNQRWQMELMSDGTFRFTAGHSGKVLDVGGMSTADGAGVIQWPWNGGPNQRWLRQTV
ncbi:MAG TPA: RICIN domain-containing protein [Acidimicrobiales bacterium]|nr:RICIN domain-containing protein [Acidimicrobiales bacterium]